MSVSDPEVVWEWAGPPLLQVLASPVTTPGGRCYLAHYVRVQDGTPGVVCLLERDGRVLLGRHRREAVGGSLEWEFPRGFGELRENPIEAARREVSEETGLETAEAEEVGQFWPDSGLLSGVVHVVRLASKSDSPSSGDGELTEFRWVTSVELTTLVASGQIRDGMTLAAWALRAAFS